MHGGVFTAGLNRLGLQSRISEYLKSPMPALDEIRDRMYQTLVRQQEFSLLQALLERASKDISVERYNSTNNATQDTAIFDVAITNQ